MALLLAMLPIYLFGNLHCLGMCGPLVMMIGKHRYKYYYFLGRTLSFTLAGVVAGAIGAVINVFFQHYHLAAATSFLFGGILLLLALQTLTGWSLPGHRWLERRIAPLQHSLTLLMLRDRPWLTFLFGFFTLALPCGQTLIVFSACALSGDPFVGGINGLAFALLTSPALFVAMHTHRLMRYAGRYYQTVVGGCSLIVGALALLRGCAEVGWINHWVINPSAASHYHIVIF